jgi:hypothetical protein
MFRPKVSRIALLLPWLVAAAGLSSMSALASHGNHGHTMDHTMQDVREAQQVAQSTPFSEEQIEAFVLASESVQEISDKWLERVKDAQSDEKRYNLEQAAQEEMVQAVRDEGLSVNEYNMIVEAVQTNPEMRRRVQEMTTEMTGQ